MGTILAAAVLLIFSAYLFESMRERQKRMLARKMLGREYFVIIKPGARGAAGP
jgi:hypothetical protein